MDNFSEYAQNNNNDKAPEVTSDADIATAEYSYFHIHQIKAWSVWPVNQEEIDYVVDSPIHLFI